MPSADLNTHLILSSNREIWHPWLARAEPGQKKCQQSSTKALHPFSERWLLADTEHLCSGGGCWIGGRRTRYTRYAPTRPIQPNPTQPSGTTSAVTGTHTHTRIKRFFASQKRTRAVPIKDGRGCRHPVPLPSRGSAAFFFFVHVFFVRGCVFFVSLRRYSTLRL